MGGIDQARGPGSRLPREGYTRLGPRIATLKVGGIYQARGPGSPPEGAASKQAWPRCATRQAVSSRTPGLGCSPGGADPVSGGVSTATHRTCRCTQAGALAQHHAKRFAIGSWCQPVTTNGPGCQPVTAERLETSRLQHRPATNPRWPSGLATRGLAKWSSSRVSPTRAMTRRRQHLAVCT